MLEWCCLLRSWSTGGALGAFFCMGGGEGRFSVRATGRGGVCGGATLEPIKGAKKLLLMECSRRASCALSTRKARKVAERAPSQPHD